MKINRHNRGPKGGQFAASDRPSDVDVDGTLMLSSRPDDDAAGEEALIGRVHEAVAQMERARDACEGKGPDSPQVWEAMNRWMEALEAHCDLYESGSPEAAVMLHSMVTDDSNRWLNRHCWECVDYGKGANHARASALDARLAGPRDYVVNLHLKMARELAKMSSRTASRRLARASRRLARTT